MNDNISFAIISLGCSKNQVDSELMISFLENEGLSYTKISEKADIIIVNTCGFIEKAREESIDTTLQVKNNFPGKIVIMAGCLTQRYKNTFRELIPEIDGFLETKDPASILALTKNIIKKRGLKYNKNSTDSNLINRKKLLSFPGSVYVKIGDGCNNNCTYCSIPLIKGPLASRNIASIIEEIEYLKKQDIFEFNIIAQDIGSFGRDTGQNENLPELLRIISRIKGEFWVRLLYIHPDHFPLDILRIIKNDKRILPYFDIPFQHGSPEILKAMGRKSDINANLDLINRIRDILPDSIIRSTFLIGFPGENENDFEKLLDFQKKAAFEWLGSFTYSQEEGTKAYSFKGSVKKGLMKKRQQKIEEGQINITEKKLKRFLGRDLPVIIEEEVKGEDLYLGRAFFNAPDVDGLVVVKSNNKLIPGKIVNARLEKLNGIDMEAVIV